MIFLSNRLRTNGAGGGEPGIPAFQRMLAITGIPGRDEGEKKEGRASPTVSIPAEQTGREKGGKNDAVATVFRGALKAEPGDQ